MLPILILDDEPIMRFALCRLLGRHAPCRNAASNAEAAEQLAAEEAWAGFVIDVSLPDGCGLDFLATARAAHSSVPAIVLTGRIDRATVNRAGALNARVTGKPMEVAQFDLFIGDVLQNGASDQSVVALERARHRWRLSTKEGEILTAALRSQRRDSLLAATGMNINTYKTHARKLLEKTGHDSISALVIDILRDCRSSHCPSRIAGGGAAPALRLPDGERQACIERDNAHAAVSPSAPRAPHITPRDDEQNGGRSPNGVMGNCAVSGK